jgi:hypothetical protein
MDAIEAVVELARERDEIAEDLDIYESWFESLVGKEVVLTVKSKKKTRFYPCTVNEFTPGEGWVLIGLDDEEETHVVTFCDFAEGRVYIKH